MRSPQESPPDKSGWIINKTATISDTVENRLDGTFNTDSEEIVNKFSDIFIATSGKFWTQTIEREPKVQSGSLKIFLKGPSVGLCTL